MEFSKEQLGKAAESATEKARAAVANIFADVEPVKGRPYIESDETLIIKANKGQAFGYFVGVIGLFIPPMIIWGIPILLITYFFSRKSGLMLTNRRLVVFNKKIQPDMYSVVSIPLKHINEVKPGWAGGKSHKFLQRLFGEGDLSISWESSRTGTRSAAIASIRRPGKVVKALREAVAAAKAQ